MKFTILSHAGLSVMRNGVKIISDPWLIGSCYWRSWWNFPEPPAGLIADLKPDFIYLTHLHWDHFHGATLKKLFSTDTHILVPKLATRRMLHDLNWLGFHNITEIPHGGSIRLGDDFTLTSFQFGLSGDSAMLLSGGGFTLFNCNDCKSFGLPLKQIMTLFPKIDFVFRSHSSASAIPHCVDCDEAALFQSRTQSEYIDEFSRFSLFIGAKYAIPFASNHCFLHKDTVKYNRLAVRPSDIPSHYNQLAKLTNSKSKCVVMPPGSSWDDINGFHIVDFDYTTQDDYVRNLRDRHKSALSRQYSTEQRVLADFEAFQAYFRMFFDSIPWPLRRWLNCRIVIRTRDAGGEHNWLIDLGAKTIEVLSQADEVTVLIETPAIVLNDCTKFKMFSVWTASKRLRISLPSPRDLRIVSYLFLLLDMYELELLPLRNNLSRRSLGIWTLRWREGFEGLRLFVRHIVFRRPFIISRLYDVDSPDVLEASR